MKELFISVHRFSIRKYSFGAASVLLGAVCLAQGPIVSADQVVDSTETAVLTVETPSETLVVSESSEMKSDARTVAENGQVSSQSDGETASAVVHLEEVSVVLTESSDSNDGASIGREKEANEASLSKVSTSDTTGPEVLTVESRTTETPVVKKTKGYAAAKVEKPATSISTDTTRRRAPKKSKETENIRVEGQGQLDEKSAIVLELETSVNSPQTEKLSQGTTTFYSSRSASAARGDDYPARFKYSSTGIDDWRLYVRQCTSFTAYRLSSVNGFELPAAYGNGGQWGYRAQREGYRVDKNPAIGSVAWWDDGGYGHVAWVSNILGSAVEIEEYNFNWSESYNKRTVAISSVSGFIHFKDLAGVGQTTAQQSATATNGQVIAENGVYTFSHRSSIRYEASLSSPELAYYDAGQTVNYDQKLEADGHEWISYLSFAGNRRYIAVKELAKPAPKESTKPTTGTITIRNNNTKTGSFDIVISDVYNSKGIGAVVVPTWSDTDGQDDIKWYEAIRQADGTYKQTVKASDHKNSTGLYHAHLYYRQADGTLVGVGGTTTTVSLQAPQVQQPTIPSSGTYRFTGRAAVRPEARMASAELAHYATGQTVNYDRVLQAEGRTWISYIAGSGNRRYIAIT
ncbi:N-acetylmuramoyl-L-alanine amidase [Streptococcus sp. DD10]|uniref:SH3 domain-containing protein n=1 Tax=Streptococcus sp. DD10 TaxID=1777878 RepID=UPI0007956E72|nr:SH3 domain-containing protein [Streptococcus sp. DD10]KXT74734.1 N-acetylmuramoyl-L-alanine amidase [Streptococcus sp. DD10]